ncbi:hypothetical protein HK101_002433 [Irineochytrium annulatum]|nr:hypothetical protein HK101_002433 [Irineochytrium annulatum]
MPSIDGTLNEEDFVKIDISAATVADAPPRAFVLNDLDDKPGKRFGWPQIKKILKGSLAVSTSSKFSFKLRVLTPLQPQYVLAFAFIFWDKTNTWVQARTFGNIVLSVIVSEPAGTVGTFLDLLFVGFIGLYLAGLCWALTNLIAGANYTAMCVVLFLFSYMFGWIRSLGPRYFGVGLIGPLMCFTAVASNVYQVTGAVTTANGSTFDQAYLRDTLYSFMIGSAICLFVNMFIFPDFAEARARHHLVRSIKLTRNLLTLLVKTFSTETDAADAKYSEHLVATINKKKKKVRKFLAQASGELYRGRYSAVELKACLEVLQNLIGDLLAVNTACQGHEKDVFESRVYQTNFAVPFAEDFKRVERGCNDLLGRVISALNGTPTAAIIDSGVLIKGQVNKAIRRMEEAQHHVMIRILKGQESGEQFTGSDDRLERGSLAIEGLTQFNFLVNGLMQASLEIDALVTGMVERPHRYKFHFNLRHYFPPLSTVWPKRDPTAPIRKPLERLSRFLLSKESIYALKCSIAVLIYQLVMFNQPAFYRRYLLQSSFLTYLVAVTPSIGQSSLGFVINMLGAALGYTWAFFAVSAWGTGYNTQDGVCYGWWACGDGATWLPQVGLTLFALIWAIPMTHLMANTRMSVLGLLSLLSFSTSVIGSWGNRNNAAYDAPWFRYFKIMAGAAMAISFALVFTM